ncbi:hypothetical protein [Ralstonia solanacearum]|uniref:hypothetical protein n=1 Tax=Ralstonia solanacearum TaxID=305 RepID=UPI000A5EB333|nr:hypothetical protein [Ralstonia solanacearum]
MLKRIAWVEDAVFSLQLREDLFALAQMRRNHIMQFFAIKSQSGKWQGVDLNEVRSLFFVFVAENKLKPIICGKVDADSVAPSWQPIPKLMLSAVIGDLGVHAASLIELSEGYSTDGKRVVKDNISKDGDIDLIYRHELAGMIGDPEKIKNRLIRLFDSGVNWDDAKSFLFKGIKLPPPEDS